MMRSEKRTINIASLLVFAITFIVYFYSAERNGSLWDCGEFVLGAYKLEVVHPPGAPLFLLVGRLFTALATLFSDNPSDIAFSVNLMSGLFSALAAMLITRVTMLLGKLTFVGKDEEMGQGEQIAVAGAGVVAGLVTAFATSIWFSAVEGEVYAMSTFFTTLTLWATVKWYTLPDTVSADRWLIFAVYATGLSVGVHLLSLLTFPALALFYYFKKYKKHTIPGMVLASFLGVVFILLSMKFIIAGIPQLWIWMELLMVNTFGLPFNSGLIPLIGILAALFYFGIKWAQKNRNHVAEMLIVSAMMMVIGFSTIGVIVIRAGVAPPINMNNPSDATRLLPYINREQYGDRALLYGPNFEGKPYDQKVEERYGQVGDRYEIVDEKISPLYRNADKMLFPRMSDGTMGRPALYRQWVGKDKGKMNFLDNLKFFFKYQLSWMYGRYFMWNFVGRQNDKQGYYSWDKSSGNWMSGIKFIDEMHLYNQDKLTTHMKKEKAANKYYFLPLIFGLLGLFFHFSRRKKDMFALLVLFLITGVGLVIYANEPPNEPRERDYVFVGSFFTFAIWVGMGVLALFDILRDRLKGKSVTWAVVASLVVLSAPVIMGFQNFDDNSRKDITAARDYAANFLNSVEKNAIIFTFGDNDTYPLWNAQEVEGIRTDVRVVNLSLIAVDWYIDLLRNRYNDSPPVKLTVPKDAYRGKKRNVLYYYNPRGKDQPMSLQAFLKFAGERHELQAAGNRKLESYLPTKSLYLPVNKQQAIKAGLINPNDSTQTVVDRIPIKINGNYIDKKDLAVLDVIGSNLWERPVYFAVTVQQKYMLGLQDYLQLEGLGLRITPVKKKSDPRYGVYGSGHVAVDKLFDNVMNKFRWGNFDKKELFVSTFYGATTQSLRMIIQRAADEALVEGKKDKAVALAEKYFEVFPNMNFRYNYWSLSMINVLLRAHEYEKAKVHMKILADNTVEDLAFLESLDADVLKSSFQSDAAMAYRVKDELIRAAKQMKDEALQKEYEEMFAPYDLEQTP